MEIWWRRAAISAWRAVWVRNVETKSVNSAMKTGLILKLDDLINWCNSRVFSSDEVFGNHRQWNARPKAPVWATVIVGATHSTTGTWTYRVAHQVAVSYVMGEGRIFSTFGSLEELENVHRRGRRSGRRESVHKCNYTFRRGTFLTMRALILWRSHQECLLTASSISLNSGATCWSLVL